MQRTFITNLALVLVLNLLVKPFYILGVDAGVQRAVGSAEYGGYAALLSLSFLLNILLDMGITSYNTRNVAQHTQLMGKYLSGIAGVRLILVFVYALLTVVAGILFGYSGEQLGMLGWLVVNQALAATLLYLRSNIAGAQRYRQDSLLSVLDRVLLIGLMTWLLWGRSTGGELQIAWFVWAQTAAYAISVVVAVVLVQRLGGRVLPRWRPALSLLMVRQSLPFALLILLMTFYYRTDTLMLERLLPDGALQAGIYAQGFRFFEALNMFGFLFAGLLLPMFSRLLGQREDVSALAGLSFRLVMAGALAVAVLGSMHARTIMDLVYNEHTEQSAPAFAVLLWCFVAVCSTYIFGTLLTAQGDLRKLNIMAAIGAVLNIGLNLWFIPRWQAEGAAWASLITQVSTAVAQMALAGALVNRGQLLKPSAHAVLYALGLVGSVVGAQALGLSFLQTLVAYVPLAICWALLCGLVRIQDLRAMPLPDRR